MPDSLEMKRMRPQFFSRMPFSMPPVWIMKFGITRWKIVPA